MRIRIKGGQFDGLVVDHNPHVAHELVRRGLAELVEAAPIETAEAAPVIETAEARPARRPRRARRQ